MKKKHQQSRREFLRHLMAATAATSIPLLGTSGDLFANTIAKGKIPKRPLGKTGYDVGIYSLGGQATLETPGKEADAIKIINRALDMGINYIDTAAWYGRPTETATQEEMQGTSERYIGKVLKNRRNEVFLATKTHDRTYDGSMRLLEKSLKNLQTDHIDLWQIHNIKGGDKEDLAKIFSKNGVLKALEKARDEKIVKFLGITGHNDPNPMRELIERYPFDNVLMAVNAADKHYNPFIERLLPFTVEKNMGIVAMKIPARDRMFANGGILTMKQAMEYVLTLPVSTIIVGLDTIAELDENIEIARNFVPLSEDEMLEIEELTKPHYRDLMFYKGLSEWPPEW